VKLRRERDDLGGRLPPNQRLTRGWPVLHASPVPKFNPALWSFRVWGEVENEVEWTWDEFRALPSATVVSDFHCVTGWSKFDNTWEGISFKEIASRVKPAAAATHVMVHAEYGYTANLPLDALLDDDVLLAWSHDRAPLEPEHGGPLRLVVPKLYAWKSAKWVRGLRFMDHDERGYWEVRGYHNDADPFVEERYSWQEVPRPGLPRA
jgi:DMSO/TMAO reductase YedYZ molybdopterin-dependent catalytic subunit